jgi:hypothetical protein
MNILNIPGFTAESSLYMTSGRYQSATKNQSYSSEGQGVVAQLRLGAFQCGPEGCQCAGGSDCWDMLSTNVCGGNVNCYIGWLTGTVICTCSR